MLLSPPESASRVRYHLIGHTDHRRDLLQRSGAAAALEHALADTCILNGWTTHAFAFLPQRYQLAVEIPCAADIRAALHMLETQLAARLETPTTRQGRTRQLNCQARLIDDPITFVTVIDHIHLEPVRASLIAPAHLATYPGSSMRQMLQSPRPPWLEATELLQQHQLPDTTAGWSTYLARLMHAASSDASGGDGARTTRSSFASSH